MLPELPQLIVFMTVAAALIATPGPAVLYVVARSVDQGRRAGITSVLGVAAGEQLQLIATAFGLAGLLAQSALAFQAVKLLGAAYLIYLGVRRLIEKDAPFDVAQPVRQPLRRIFGEGLIVSFLNPKSALFFAAFLPQFVDPGRGSVEIQILSLGAVFLAIAVMSDSIYASAAGTMSGWLRGHRGFARTQRYVTGGVYLSLGLATAVSGSNSK